jgi:hypothetical protein
MTDRFLFWLNLDMLEYGLAHSLQKKINAEYYAISDAHESLKKFFQKQNIVNFKNIWYYRDYTKNNFTEPDMTYLKNFEKKYNISIWKLAYSEILFFDKIRYHKFSNKEILSTIEKECKFFESVLEEIKPNYVFVNYFSGHHTFLFCQMCKSLGIKILMHAVTRTGYRVAITSHVDALEYFDEPFPKSSTSNRSVDELQEWFQKFNLKKSVVENQSRYTERVTSFQKVTAMIKYLRIITSDDFKNFYGNSDITVFNILKRKISLKFKKWKHNRYLKTNFYYTPDLNQKYVYYPLQIEPERAISFGAPFQPNQLELIMLIAKSLPIDFKFYVKEHPLISWQDGRDFSFYKKIINLPNVYFLPSTIDSEKLIKNSSLVVTINGTSALEAAFFGIPSLVFGKTGWSSLPSIESVENLEDLPEIIHRSLEKHPDIKDLNLFVDYMETNSFEMDYRLLESNFFSSLYYGGYFGHDEISVNQVQKMLNENQKLLEIITNEHIKKLSKFTK